MASDNAADAVPASIAAQEQNSCRHPTVTTTTTTIPKSLSSDLLVLLTRLEIPLGTSTPEDAVWGPLAASLLERLAQLWTTVAAGSSNNKNNNGTKVGLLEDAAVVTLLHRLLECRCDHTNLARSQASLTWLRLLNHHFMTLEDENNHRGTTAAMTEEEQQVSFAFAWQRVLVPLLAEFVKTARDTVHLTPWQVATDAPSEARVQWRILTGYLVEWAVVTQQQQVGASSSVPSSVERWLYDGFRQANTDAAALDFPHEVLVHAVRDLLTQLTSYMTELTDYALDALDGAAVSFASVHRDGGGTIHPPRNMVHDDVMAAFATAEHAVQDSLRHVTVATNVLAAVRPWCSGQAQDDNDSFSVRLGQIQKQQLVHLWVTLAPSFMGKSDTTTVLNYKNFYDFNPQLDDDEDLGARICHHQLQLAELVLSSSVEDPNTAALAGGSKSSSGYETTLCLTFLRGLGFPELLLSADQLWYGIEQRLGGGGLPPPHRELKRMLQAAVLTLRQQHMLPVAVAAPDGGSVAYSHHHPSQQQQSAQAVADRLLSLLKTTMKTPEGAGGDPWDGFFWRQVTGFGLLQHNNVNE